MRRSYAPWAAMAFLAMAAVAPAQWFADNFDADHTANWTVNVGTATGDHNANFFFDYSTIGVSSAPRSTGGTTRGLRMLANQSNGVFTGLSASPTGQSFSGDFYVRADVWLNFVGPAPVGGSGSTQAGGMGIGTAGTTAQWAGGTQDSIHFSTTTDGNSSVDWRAYSSVAATGYLPASGVFAAGTDANARNHDHAYYASFGQLTPPAAQTALYPNQTGTTLIGSAGFKWHDMVVRRTGNSVTWTVDNLLIATVDASTVTMGGSNILLNYFDTNATSSADPNDFLNCIIFDNVYVVPEPATMAVLGMGALALVRRRRK